MSNLSQYVCGLSGIFLLVIMSVIQYYEHHVHEVKEVVVVKTPAPKPARISSAEAKFLQLMDELTGSAYARNLKADDHLFMNQFEVARMSEQFDPNLLAKMNAIDNHEDDAALHEMDLKSGYRSFGFSFDGTMTQAEQDDATKQIQISMALELGRYHYKQIHVEWMNITEIGNDGSRKLLKSGANCAKGSTGCSASPPCPEDSTRPEYTLPIGITYCQCAEQWAVKRREDRASGGQCSCWQSEPVSFCEERYGNEMSVHTTWLQASKNERCFQGIKYLPCQICGSGSKNDDERLCSYCECVEKLKELKQQRDPAEPANVNRVWKFEQYQKCALYASDKPNVGCVAGQNCVACSGQYLPRHDEPL